MPSIPTMHLLSLLSLLIIFATLATSSTIPFPSTLLTPSSIQNTPWPPPPYHISLSTISPLQMTIYDYGSPGPSTTDATTLLKTVFENLSAGGAEGDKMVNHTETVTGLRAEFAETGTGQGVTRVEAMAVLRRVWGLTIVHGAVGIQRCDIEMGGKVVEGFQLEYMFEGQ